VVNTQLFLTYVAGGYSASSAARKVGVHLDDIRALQAADPAFAHALAEAMGEGSDAFSSSRQPRPKQGRAGTLF
jgi:hypothetical protein